RDHPLADGDQVGVVVHPAELRGLGVPAERAAGTLHAVGYHGLAVARAAEDNAALELAPHHRQRHRADEDRVIHLLLGVGAKILHLVPELLQKFPDAFLVLEAGVIAANRNIHSVYRNFFGPEGRTRNRTKPAKGNESYTDAKLQSA